MTSPVEKEQDRVERARLSFDLNSPLWVLIIFLLALIPRVAMWGHIVTVDEAYHWFYRSSVFLRAVQNGAYGDTNLIGHPGVTTMWLGSIGLLRLKDFYSRMHPPTMGMTLGSGCVLIASMRSRCRCYAASSMPVSPC